VPLPVVARKEQQVMVNRFVPAVWQAMRINLNKKLNQLLTSILTSDNEKLSSA
jgi:hypothetical protein